MPAPTTLARPVETAVSTVAASVAVRPLLEGPPARAAPLGTAAGVAWMQVGDYVLALAGIGAIRAPNGIVASSPDLLARVMAGCSIGNGHLQAEALQAAVGRWWDPRPALGTVTGPALAYNARQLAALIGGDQAPTPPTPGEVIATALGRIGSGPGLTPEADDFVVGLLAGLRLLAPSAGAGEAVGLLDAIAPAVAAATSSTTALSATLIRHGFRGEVVAPLGALFGALAGSGRLDHAVAELGRLGATSGRAMGRGALAAARLAVGMVDDDR